MEIHKLKCDACGKEKDLLEQRFGGEQEFWQELHTKNEHSHSPKIEHACSFECAIKILEKERK